MARVLAYTHPGRGHLYPLVPVLDELSRRGHEICVRTLASELELLRDRGFSAAAHDFPAADDQQSAQPGKDVRTLFSKLRRRVANFPALTEPAGHYRWVKAIQGRVTVAAVEIPDMQAAIEQERPDLLLVDYTTFGAAAVAEMSGLPWAQWFVSPLPVPSRDVPPYGPGLPRATNSLGRARERLLRPVLLGSMTRAVLPPVNRARALAGAPPVTSIEQLFTRPPLALLMSAEPFEYARSDWPPSVRMIGPCDWDTPAEPPEWLAQLERPLVLVATSSEVQHDEGLVTTALEAFADEPVNVVATAPAGNAGDFPVPANARVERFVPYSFVLPRAACVVTHGGARVTQSALAAGVPVCAVPYGRDQHEVARRVEACGAGTRLAPSRLSAERLRQKVREAMTMRDGARRVAAGFEATGGAAAGADAVERLCSSNGPLERPPTVLA
jgi:MGT family glycosyltransferase